MRIKKVLIRNYGPLETGIWNIDTSSNLILLCGPHGSGKSTFLRAIEHCLSRTIGLGLHSVLPPYLWLDEEDSRNPESFSVELEVNSISSSDNKFFNCENKILKYPSLENLESSRWKEFGPRVPFGFISSDDYIPRFGFTHCKYSFAKYNSDIELLWLKKPDLPLNPVDMLAASIEFMRSKHMKSDNVLQIINENLSKVVDLKITIDDDSLYCTRLSNPRATQLDFLSDAEYYTISVFLFAFIFLPPSGVLILDSPETHLSPSSQYNMLSSILPRFKDGQVIVATHSPSLIASKINQGIYVLERSQGIQMPIRAENDKTIRIIRELYGCDVSKSVLSALSDYSSSQILAYLLECSIEPEAMSRRKGDPQIQQLATWLLGHLQATDQKRITLVDVGAGKGDLLTAIQASCCTERLKYVPVEPNTKLWNSIEDRAKEIPSLDYVAPTKCMSCLGKADLVFFINVIHELDLHERIELISQALRLLSPKGVLVIHEVAVLPRGESDFVVWNGADIKSIFENAGIDEAKITSAKTRTRPGGWPLEFTCIKADEYPPDSKKLTDAAMKSLEGILSRWVQELMDDNYEEINEELRDRLKAFRMAQIANLCVWIKKYSC